MTHDRAAKEGELWQEALRRIPEATRRVWWSAYLPTAVAEQLEQAIAATQRAPEPRYQGLRDSINHLIWTVETEIQGGRRSAAFIKQHREKIRYWIEQVRERLAAAERGTAGDANGSRFHSPIEIGADGEPRYAAGTASLSGDEMSAHMREMLKAAIHMAEMGEIPAKVTIERWRAEASQRSETPCPTCQGERVVESKPAGAGHSDDLAEYVPCPDCKSLDAYLVNIRKLASESEDPELGDYMAEIQRLLAAERATQRSETGTRDWLCVHIAALEPGDESDELFIRGYLAAKNEALVLAERAAKERA